MPVVLILIAVAVQIRTAIRNRINQISDEQDARARTLSVENDVRDPLLEVESVCNHKIGLPQEGSLARRELERVRVLTG